MKTEYKTTKSALWSGDVLMNTDGVVLANVSSFKDAEMWCLANGYTLRLSGTSQSSDTAVILRELAELDARISM